MQIQKENGSDYRSKDYKELQVEIRTIRSKLSVAAFSLLNEISFSRFLEQVDSKIWQLHLPIRNKIN